MRHISHNYVDLLLIKPRFHIKYYIEHQQLQIHTKAHIILIYFKVQMFTRCTSLITGVEAVSHTQGNNPRDIEGPLLPT